MKKEKESERPHIFSVQNWPLDTITPVDIVNQVDMFPARGISITDELPEEENS